MQENLSQRIDKWLFEFLHSPCAFGGRSAEEIWQLDFNESKAIFKKELAKRKAKEELVEYKSFDDLKLRFWYISQEKNQNLKVLLHGSGSNFAKADRAIYLLDRGFNVALISYRGHSGNPSANIDQKIIIKDVEACLYYLLETNYQAKNIFLEGSSLGTCIFAHVVSRIKDKKNIIFKSLLLKAAPLNIDTNDEFTLESLTRHKIDYNKAKVYLQKIWNQKDAYHNVYADEIKIIHGAKDDMVPLEHAFEIEKILKKKNPNVSLQVLESEGHRIDLNQYEVF